MMHASINMTMMEMKLEGEILATELWTLNDIDEEQTGGDEQAIAEVVQTAAAHHIALISLGVVILGFSQR